MRNKNILLKFSAIAFLVIVSFAFTSGDGGKKTTFKGNLKAGDSYRFFINNIEMPMNWEGVLADVSIDGREGGRVGENTFLFSGGFFLSGKTNGTPWANAVASASRVQDYERGTYEFGTNDSRNGIYVLKQSDGDFADSWMEWKDAVALGAYYYDGDGDGKYDPVDLNGNGKWDPTEDRPDLIGDATAWLVIKDSQRPSLRRYIDVSPQGIEIRQSIFGFASKGVTGNMIFVRYSILNTGLVADTLDDVYFGVWADADIGGTVGYTDDLVGCDTTLNAGFTYNDGDDPQWGATPPCFLIDFFQGPISYVPGVSFTDNNGNGVYDDGVDTPLDTAHNVRGQVRGVAEYPGALNQGLSSFVQYIQSHPTQGDPNTQFEARNYMLGYDKFGNNVDPATWSFGGVFQNGVQLTDTAAIRALRINPKFMYSGDPVTKNGWLNIGPDDQRQMSNTGPFKLIKGQPVDIVAAYVVGIGQNAANSVTVAKEYDQVAQLLFDTNFPTLPSPPPINYSVKNGSNFIDISWDTYEQANYVGIDTVLGVERRLQGFYVTAFRTRSKSDLVAGQVNSKIIADYQIDNFIKSVYQIAPNGGQNLIIKEANASNKLNPTIYSDPTSGRIKLRLERDPFTNEPFVKGHEYYFAITQYYLNHDVIVPRSGGTYGTVGDYYDPVGSAYEEFETPLIFAIFGEDQYAPAFRGTPGTRLSGASDGDVKILTVNSDQLTGDEYTVEFFEDVNQAPGTPYLPFWRVKNNRTNAVVIDSSKTYDFDTTKYAGKVVDGFIVKVKPVQAQINLESPTYTPAANKWYTSFRSDSATGVFYVGKDLPQGTPAVIGGTNNAQSNYIRANKLRTVEIRFGVPGKAYRYLNGFKGTPITRRTTYIYAPYIFAADTNGSGIQKFGEGFVDVPFQVWVKDDKYGEERQLAVGFVELSKTLFGNPDGVWDPGTLTTPFGNEAIIIFDAPYDPNGNQKVYTGGAGTYSGSNWPDVIKGYNLNDPAATTDEIAQAQSQFFNAMYVVSLKKNASGAFYQPGDVLKIPMVTYPYTSADKFTFRTVFKGQLSEDQQRDLWNKVNVFPNPLFGFNPATSYDPNNSPDEPFVTFSNLPDEVTIKIFTLGGTLVRTLNTSDKSSPSSTFLRWNLKNEDGLRVASGLYIAIVSSPRFGEKILKFSIIQPQKQIQQY
uniref:T9SS type A sorting domain-containing protein n=1 Tax=Ignavibacterium album TaxID=591197 RepID=A0A7V2ZLH0_9BACT